MNNRNIPLARLTFLLFCFGAAALFAQAPSPELASFLREQLSFDSLEFDALEKGQIIVKLPKTVETREVAAFAIMRLDVPPQFFVERVRDIVNFKKSANVLQIGKFSNPPRLEDLAGLTLDPADIEALRQCKLNRCGFKMSAHFIERFRKEINWAAPDSRDRATELMRQILLQHVQVYLQGGNAALGEYRDKSYPLRIGDEFRSLLQPAPYMYDYVPEFQKYLEEFPAGRPHDSENFVYWSKEKFGLKPVVSLTHITIYKGHRPNGADLLIASKGLYASHYFEASLGVTAFVRSSSDPSRSYLIYINRSRADALRGMFAGLKRSLISGSLQDGAKKNMELTKQKLETEYRK